MSNQKIITFYGLLFAVSHDAFIPYPESEALIELALKLNPRTILDIGTGVGNIAISIGKKVADAQITGIDISPKELQLAKKNAQFLQVSDRVIFKKSNLLENIDSPSDLFIGNLPFIPTSRIPFLKEADGSASAISLDGGEDGFEVYRQLFLQMIQKNIYPRFLIAEIDYSHQFLALTESLKYFPKAKVDIKTDRRQRKIRILFIEF